MEPGWFVLSCELLWVFVCCACSIAPALPAGDESNSGCGRPKADSSGPTQADPPSTSAAEDPGEGVQKQWAGTEA